MPQYLLSIQQPAGDRPAPEVLEPIMREVAAVNDEIRAAGAWVFAAGLFPPGPRPITRHPRRARQVATPKTKK